MINDREWPLLRDLATYCVCRTSRVGNLNLTAETASRRHVRIWARTRKGDASWLNSALLDVFEAFSKPR